MVLNWNAHLATNHGYLSRTSKHMECNQTSRDQPLVSRKRSLPATLIEGVWSYEPSRTPSQHNLDAEAELTAVLAQEINLEIGPVKFSATFATTPARRLVGLQIRPW